MARGSSGSGGTCSRSRGTFSPLRYDVIASRRERSALALAFIRVSDVVTDPMITAFAEMPTIATKSEQTVCARLPGLQKLNPETFNSPHTSAYVYADPMSLVAAASSSAGSSGTAAGSTAA